MDRQLVIAILVVLAVASVMYVFVYPYLSGDIKAQKRQSGLVKRNAERASGLKGVDPAKRRKAIADSLKEIEEKNKTKRITLENKIAQAGLSWSKQAFLVGSVVFGIILAFLTFAFNRDLLVTGGALAVGIFGLPNWIFPSCASDASTSSRKNSQARLT